MKHVDAAVIGAGVLGCFAARALTRRNISVLVLEKREDVCTGITKANSGIIYTGCDNRPGSVKAGMCVRANERFDELCRDLGVRFSRCGSLMVSFGPRGEAVLLKKLRNGERSGVQGMQILPREEVLRMEPGLSPEITAGLYVPGTGTVDPWELGIAAYENARANGAEFLLNTQLLSMERTGGGFLLRTARTCGDFVASVAEETVFAKTVINCAGLFSDAVREMVMRPAVRIRPDAADYIVLDDTAQGYVKHIIFHEPEWGPSWGQTPRRERDSEEGSDRASDEGSDLTGRGLTARKGGRTPKKTTKKGLTLVPTVDGKLLIGATERNPGTAPDGAVSLPGLAELKRLCGEVVPGLPLSEQIRTFSALRPNPYAVDALDHSIHDFSIFHEDGLISLIGIKTPGLTCAAELGERCARLAAGDLKDPGPNPSFDPVRRAPVRVHGMDEAERALLVQADPAYGEILCMCGDISRGEIRDAIRRGAVTLDGVKRRTGSFSGRCQGARCMKEIMEMLSAITGVPPEEVTKNGAGSQILRA